MPQSVVRGRRKFCASVNSSKGKLATEQLVHKGLGAESEEKREPVSDIDTGVVGSLKVLDPAGRLEKPISRQRWEAVGPGSKKPERLAFDGRGRKVNQHPSLFERQDSTLVAWYRSIYAPRTGGAYDSHHRTAGIAGCTRRRGGGVAARGARSSGDAGWRFAFVSNRSLKCGDF